MGLTLPSDGARSTCTGVRLVEAIRCPSCAPVDRRNSESSINGESGREAVSSQLTGAGADETASGEYGANEWLVDEMYAKFLADPDSVDKSWWPVLEQYGRQPEQAAASGAPARRGSCGSRCPGARAARSSGPAPRRARSPQAPAPAPQAEARRTRRQPHSRTGHRAHPGDRPDACRPHHLRGAPHDSRAGRRARHEPAADHRRRPPRRRGRPAPRACPRPSPRTWTRR